MRPTSEPLFHELDRLKGIFSSLSSRLLAASNEFRKSAVPVPEDLVAELSDFKQSVADLGSRILDLSKELSLTIELPVTNLEELARSLHILKGVEEQRENAEAKDNALAVIERVLRIVRRDGAAFIPLQTCQAKALELRDSIMQSPASELQPAARELSDGTHAFSRLLGLVEHQNDFTDEECISFQEAISESLGKDLAIAAIRGRLEVPPLTIASVSSATDDSVQSSSSEFDQESVSSSDAESFTAAHEMRLGAPGSFAISPNPEVDQEIKEFLAGLTGKAQLGRSSVVSSALALKNEVAAPETHLTGGQPKEETSPMPLSAPIAEASDLEVLKLEDEADLCRAEGRYSEAETLYQQLLVVQEKLLPPGDQNIARTLNNLAAIRHFQNNIAPPAVASVEPASVPQSAEIQEQKLAQERELFTAFNRNSTKATAEPQAGKFRVLRVLQVMMLIAAVLGAGALLYGPLRSRFMNLGIFPAQPTVAPAASVPPTLPSPESAPMQQSAPAPISQTQELGQQGVTSSPAVPSSPSSTLGTIPAAPTLPRPVEEPRETLRPNSGPQREAVPRSEARQAPAKPQLLPEPLEPQESNPISKPTATKKPESAPPPLAAVGSPSNVSVAALKGLIGSTDQVPAPPPSPPPIRMSGELAAAKLISQTEVTYPPLARQSHVQGTVRLQAVIGKDGSVKQLAVLSGHQLLTRAAMDAVKQWRYQPALQNGVPVEVITTVDVNFSLE